jgi:hypothetical protein
MRAVRLSESGTTLDNVFIRPEAGLPLDRVWRSRLRRRGGSHVPAENSRPERSLLPFGFQNNRRARRPRAVVRRQCPDRRQAADDRAVSQRSASILTASDLAEQVVLGHRDEHINGFTERECRWHIDVDRDA